MELKINKKYTIANISELQFKIIYQALREKDTTEEAMSYVQARNDLLDHMSEEYERLNPSE